MRKRFKILILTTILLTPAGIYIFLQTFGNNEFDLPLNSENAEQQTKSFMFEGLYDINGTKIDLNTYSDEIIVLEFVSAISKHSEQDYQIKRISDIFRDEGSVRIIRVFVNDNFTDSITTSVFDQSEGNISVLYTGYKEMNKMSESIKPSGESHEPGKGFDKMHLLDDKHRIRGSYFINDFEEMDRLILEVKILLKKEKHA
jgi:protein SCO1/2